MVMQSMLKQYSRDFVQRVRSDRFGPCVTAAPHRRRTSEHVSQQKFEHEGMHSGACSAFFIRACMFCHHCCSGQVAANEANRQYSWWCHGLHAYLDAAAVDKGWC